MLKGFKDFIMRGNLVELAVAVIIATAFGAVVTAFTNVLLGLIGKVTGGTPNFDNFTILDETNAAGEVIEGSGVPIGIFLTALVTFLIIAFVVYFFVITPYNKLEERRAKGDEEPEPPAADVALLTEIRDLLKEQRGSTT
ncbi:large conductance mechanosensitive channel protein MscL [Nocardioidaceae bacterium]|nr:large conductance mechanosensitive channel protein MscL [Nocardioidaceae bacterium]